ncbi:MAG: hypothetical protein AAB383_04040 [Patescibacteria group bacterium]
MKKVILISSFTLCASTVMPWYDQRNNFGVGDTFIGVQGPLFAVGLVVLGCGAVSFFNMFLPLMGRNFFDLKRKSGSLGLTLGTQALLLLLVANSIFYHPEFATTINNKGTRFGMIVAFLSIGALMISGWWTRRKEKAEQGTLASGEGEEREDDLEDAYVAPVTSSRPLYEPTQERPQYAAPRAVEPTPAPTAPVDPLTLDAKTRYKMLQSQGRYSSTARNNLWGSGGGSAYGRSNRDDNQ